MTIPLQDLRRELARKIAFYVGDAESKKSEIPGLILVRRTGATGPICTNYEPSIAVIAQGQKRVELGKSTFFYDETRYLLTSLDLPTTSQVIGASQKNPFIGLAFRLELPVVREILVKEEIPVREGAGEMPAMSTAETTPELMEACLRLVNLLDTPKDIPFLCGLIEREIIYRILQGPEAARLRAIATLGDQSQRTAKAIQWIRANYQKSVRVEELAEIAGMGVSTFHQHFRALTAMSPLQYQKQLRLHAARGRMLMDGLDAASAAFEVGYESASQFNREYSRYFGQPPMRDVRSQKVLT